MFYGFRVDYFVHGLVTRSYIKNELVAYNQQWPDRQYTLGDTITIEERGPQTTARCQIAFKLGNAKQNRNATGIMRATFALARRPDMRWQIVGQHEERVRPVTKHRTTRKPKPPLLKRMGRTLRKIFH